MSFNGVFPLYLAGCQTLFTTLPGSEVFIVGLYDSHLISSFALNIVYRGPNSTNYKYIHILPF